MQGLSRSISYLNPSFTSLTNNQVILKNILNVQLSNDNWDEDECTFTVKYGGILFSIVLLSLLHHTV